MSSARMGKGKYAWFVGGTADLIQAVVADASLHDWMLSLEEISEEQRVVELTMLAQRMRADEVEAKIVAVVEAMRHRPIFDGVIRTLRDMD